jgi:hypothetical protein
VGTASTHGRAANSSPERKAAEPTIYLSNTQISIVRQSIVITTADGRPERLVPQIRAELAKLDP